MLVPAYVVGTIVPPGGDTHAVFHHVAVITFLTYAMGAVPMSIWYNRKWSTTLKTAVDSVLYALATRANGEVFPNATF